MPIYTDHDYDFDVHQVLGVFSTPMKAAMAVKNDYKSLEEYKKSKATKRENKELSFFFKRKMIRDDQKKTPRYQRGLTEKSWHPRFLFGAHGKLVRGSYEVYVLDIDETAYDDYHGWLTD